MKNKKTILILIILGIVFTIMGGSLAYYNWQTSSSQQTLVTFTATPSFSCSADGGGDITSGQVNLVPTRCNDSENAIKRIVTVNTVLNNQGENIMMDLWLNVDTLSDGLKNSTNFKYALTKGSSSCTDQQEIEGNFNGKVQNDKVKLLEEKKYSESARETYYLWIWLDSAESSTSTMNQNFKLSLGGECKENPETTFTINGAASETITISDNSGNSVATVTTDSTGAMTTLDGINATSITLESGTYTFTSSVANPVGETSGNYSKTVNVDGNTEMVNVYPDGALYWYGVYPSSAGSFTGYNYARSDDDGYNTATQKPTITNNTNDVYLKVSNSKAGGTAAFPNKININGGRLVIRYTNSRNSSYLNLFIEENLASTYAPDKKISISTGDTARVDTLDLTDVSGSYTVGVYLCANATPTQSHLRIQSLVYEP